MAQSTTFRPIARNRFNGNGNENFRPVCLDDILSMLVRYEGSSPLDPPEEISRTTSAAPIDPNPESVLVTISEIPTSEGIQS
jgi:hypothetical protein